MGNNASVRSEQECPPRPLEEICGKIESSLPKTYVDTFASPGWVPLEQRDSEVPLEDFPGGTCWGRGSGGTSSQYPQTVSPLEERRGSYVKYSQPSRELENYGDFLSASSLGPVTSATPSAARRNVVPPPTRKALTAVERMHRVIAASRTRVAVYGNPKNHVAFLEPSLLESVLPFMFGEALTTCLAVCPHWFHTIYSYLKLASAPVVRRFINQTSGPLDYLGSTLSLQPLFTAGGAQTVRIDCLLYAKATSAAVGKCTQVGYSFRYASRPEAPSAVVPPEGSSFHPNSDDDRIYTHLFRFETLRKGQSRTLWLQRDLTRFHGDEIMVAKLPVVPTVCVGDVLEIPIPLSHGFGRVDIGSVAWDPPVAVPESLRAFGQSSEYERKEANWHTLDEFQRTTSERLQINDIFHPQWLHKRTLFTGIDIAVSRSEYVARQLGSVAQSRRWLGVDCVVLERNASIVAPLTRLGLQHDRFNKLQARLGDKIVLYISQGGGIVQ